jgi:hypothetical protein
MPYELPYVVGRAMIRTTIEPPPLLQLQELRFRCGGEVTDVDALVLARRCPELRRLEITDTEYPGRGLNPLRLEEVLWCCPHLAYLKLHKSACSEATALRAISQRPQLRIIYEKRSSDLLW